MNFTRRSIIPDSQQEPGGLYGRYFVHRPATSVGIDGGLPEARRLAGHGGVGDAHMPMPSFQMEKLPEVWCHPVGSP